MCARFSISGERLSRFLKLGSKLNFERSYNLAPTDVAPVLGQSKSGERNVRLMQFGLIPHWAKDKSVAHKMINARADSLAERPAFRDAFQRRRCLVPADGFFEWAHIDDPALQVQLYGKVAKKGVKQPFFITPADAELFFLAGLWDKWDGPDGEPIETFTIITTEPNELIEKIHSRMPAIMPPEHFDLWLDRSFDNTDALQALLQPYPAEKMQATPVSRAVNDPKYKGDDCLTPVALGE